MKETFLSYACKMNFNVTLCSVLLYLYLLENLFNLFIGLYAILKSNL